MNTTDRTRFPYVAKTVHPGSPAGRSRVDHRDGAGHLAAAYGASHQDRAAYRARKAEDHAFVTGTWCADSMAEESAEAFLVTVTSGEDGGNSNLDPIFLEEVFLEEDGGPFVVTSSETEFAYGTDPSNPVGATQEPFPRT